MFLMAASSSVATVRVSRNAKTDLAMAIEEMQKANYFTFVVLINLAPPDELVHANLTFLMPKDMSLSGNTAYLKHPSSVADFLLRHSIPSPLLLEHLLRFPTGSILPTSQPGFFSEHHQWWQKKKFLSQQRKDHQPQHLHPRIFNQMSRRRWCDPTPEVSFHTEACHSSSTSGDTLSNSIWLRPELSKPLTATF